MEKSKGNWSVWVLIFDGAEEKSSAKKYVKNRSATTKTLTCQKYLLKKAYILERTTH